MNEKKSVHEELGIQKETDKSGADQLKDFSDKFDILEELQRQRDDNNDELGYTIDADLIFKAWKRFRPENQDAAVKRRNPRNKALKIKPIFGKYFINQLMSEIHLRLYNFDESDEQMQQRKSFKTDFSHIYKKKKEEVKPKDRQADVKFNEKEERVP